jgi:hypothetical protein
MQINCILCCTQWACANYFGKNFLLSAEYSNLIGCCWTYGVFVQVVEKKNWRHYAHVLPINQNGGCSPRMKRQAACFSKQPYTNPLGLYTICNPKKGPLIILSCSLILCNYIVWNGVWAIEKKNLKSNETI